MQATKTFHQQVMYNLENKYGAKVSTVEHLLAAFYF